MPDPTPQSPTTDPLATLSARLTAALAASMGGSLPPGAGPMLTPSKDPKHGDFQSNACMPLAKQAGLNPRALAEKVLANLDLHDIAEKPEIAGPGFINIRLKPAALAAALAGMDNDSLGVTPVVPKSTIVVDLCGVNLAKQMHVGHIRATVIGDALARLHERLGWHVVRQNHFGDWGLPIAMVTDAVKRRADAGTLDLKSLTLDQLEKLYRAAQRHCDADEKGLAAVKKYALGPKAEAELGAQVEGASENMARAKSALVALQSHDPAYYKVWQEISRVTLAACFAALSRLGAHVTDEHTAGESTYAEELAGIVEDLQKRGVATESDGALVVRLDDRGIKEPCIIRKSTPPGQTGGGGFLYATTDFAAIRRRVQKLGASKVVYAVDARQSLHFQQVFAGATKAGYARHASGGDAELVHAAFGTILGEDGRPFKTRTGENVKLIDLLDEAVERAARTVREKNPSLSAEETREVAEAVAMGAIKYADLSSDRVKDYVFSFDRMLAFEGNTGPYLQYAVVRIRSIFRKAKEQGVEVNQLSEPTCLGALSAPEEKAIALELLKYPGVLRAAAEACEPHRLCGYLYDLAQAFSTFFAACPVLQAPDDATRAARLRLCALAERVLADGLTTLGIKVLSRM
ncbi:MAG: arginine--tRNA ligase [Phycisphaerales bacterium]